MNRFWGHSLSVAGLAVAAACAAPACAHDDATLFVHGVLYPPTPSAGVCSYTADPTSPALVRGLVDGALRTNYTPAFLLGNTLIPQGNATTPDSETARIEIQGGIVQVVDPTDNSTWENNTVLASTIIEPASGIQPSYSTLSLSVMDAKAIAHFTPPLVTTNAPATTAPATNLALVYVTFFGQTLGGQSVQSNQYQFPVDVCDGCLVTAPTGAPPGYCQGAVAIATSFVACEVGQDQVVDCQECCGVVTNKECPVAACNLTPQ
jgi:hypothetical protein